MKIEIGLMLFLSGSKSSKLARAFRLLNHDNKNGNSRADDDTSDSSVCSIFLSTAQLTTMFESFLTAIFATVSSSDELDVDETDKLILDVSNFAATKVTQVRFAQLSWLLNSQKC